MRALFLIPLALCALCADLGASTILVYVEEHMEPESELELHPVRQGLLDGLFEAGHIFFDPGDELIGDIEWQSGFSGRLRGMAASGGASLLLLVRAETQVTPQPRGRPLVAVSLHYRLVDLTGQPDRSVVVGSFTTDNTGRENLTDTLMVDREAGLRVVSILDDEIRTRDQ